MITRAQKIQALKAFIEGKPSTFLPGLHSICTDGICQTRTPEGEELTLTEKQMHELIESMGPFRTHMIIT